MRPDTTYDPEANAVYIRLSDAPAHEGAEVSPGVVLDFDAEGRVVGIEVMNATTPLAPGAWSKASPPASGGRHAAE